MRRSVMRFWNNFSHLTFSSLPHSLSLSLWVQRFTCLTVFYEATKCRARSMLLSRSSFSLYLPLCMYTYMYAHLFHSDAPARTLINTSFYIVSPTPLFKTLQCSYILRAQFSACWITN